MPRVTLLWRAYDDMLARALASGIFWMARALQPRRAPTMTRRAFITAALSLTLLAAGRNAAAEENVGVGTIVAVSESPERSLRVTASVQRRVVASCETPCRLYLPPGHYELRAEDIDRVLRARVLVSSGGTQWVRFGIDDAVRRYTGLALTLFGVAATAIATDNLRFTASPPDSGVRPWAAQFVDGLTRDVALATSVALLPAAFALLARGSDVLRSSTRRGVVLSPALWREPRARISSVSVTPLSGGGIVGLTLTY